MPNTLITGANRGLGLELAKQYGDDGWRVFACCRKPESADALNDLASASGDRITVHDLDVSRPDSVATLSAALDGQPIDVLLNNAGMYGDESRADFGAIDYDRWAQTFAVNVMGAMRVVEAFADRVAAGEKKTLAFMSSLMGSMADNGSGGAYLYRSSKAALNAVAKSLSVDLAGRRVISVVLHPGWVQTDMGGSAADITADEAARGLMARFGELNLSSTGCFETWDGREHPF